MITITKLINGNVQVDNSNSATIETLRSTYMPVKTSSSVLIKTIEYNQVASFRPIEVDKLVKMDGSEVTSPDLDTLFSELSKNFFSPSMSPTEYKYEVAMGKIQGRTTWNKLGYNLDVDSGSPEVIASFGGNINIMTSADTLDVVSSSANDTSEGTGAKSIQIIGIDENNLSQTEVVTLNGTTPVTTVNQWLGVNRVIVLSSGSSNYNEGDIDLDDTSNTVGIQAQVPAQNSVTQQCIFHTQINHTLLVDFLQFNVRRVSSGGSDISYTIIGYSYSRVTGTRYEFYRYDGSTRVQIDIPELLKQPIVFNGREVVWFECTTNTNNTIVNGRFSGIEERVI